jgi:hypothetical protein
MQIPPTLYTKRSKKNPNHVAFVEKPTEEWRQMAKDKIYKGVFVEVRSLFSFPVPH